MCNDKTVRAVWRESEERNMEILIPASGTLPAPDDFKIAHEPKSGSLPPMPPVWPTTIKLSLVGAGLPAIHLGQPFIFGHFIAGKPDSYSNMKG